MGPTMIGSYDYRFVALSVLIAVMASHAALDLGGRITAARGWIRLLWLTTGATAMGIGIWSMHYVGMQAFSLPVAVLYDRPTVLVSLLEGVLASAAALFVISRRSMGWHRGVAGGIVMGGGIAGLHYTAMAAMRMHAIVRYSWPLVGLSIVFAMAFSLVSLWLTFSYRDRVAGGRLGKAASAVLMGMAVSAMHYTGMAAASYAPSDAAPDLSRAVTISALGVAGVGIVSLMVIEVALLTAIVDQLSKRTTLLDALFEQASEGLALLDSRNRVQRVNREFTQIFGYTLDESVGRVLSDLIAPGELREEEERPAALAGCGKRVEAEGVRVRKDGSQLVVSMLRVPVSLPVGGVVTYAIYRDITERKRLDRALRATTEQLRALSARLTFVREEEGARIARELHDELGSALTSLKWDLESVDKILYHTDNQAYPSTFREKITGMMGLIETTIATVKRIASELRPTLLDDLGLAAAIEWQAQQFEGRTGIVCKVDSLVENTNLSLEQATAFFRVFQEALTNILRHSRATRVNIMIEEEGGEFILEVKDNGRGITKDEIGRTESLGLIGMQERVHLAGGSIEITGVPGKGTTVIVRVGLTPPGAAESSQQRGEPPSHNQI
jgi:PAS domain S-box-containing protein